MRTKSKELTITFEEDLHHVSSPLFLYHSKNFYNRYYDIVLISQGEKLTKTILYMVVMFNVEHKEAYRWFLYRRDKFLPILEGDSLDYHKRLPKESIQIVERFYYDGIL